MASQDALDAAKAVGTPDQDLTAARREYAAAEQMLHEAQAAYQGQQVALSRDRLQAADATFRRAEEAAVGAGLRQLEQELAKDYGRPASQDSRAGRRVGGTVRANQGSITLLDGAGTRSQVIGTAQPGDTLTILAESGEWYRVRTGTGLVGWVSKRLVTQVQRP
jgi:hypothetical protein